MYYFENGGAPEIWCGSADWMERNFFRRIEVAFPIQRDTHRQRVFADLECYLADNCQAWVLQPDGKYIQERPRDEPARSVQGELLATIANS